MIKFVGKGLELVVLGQMMAVLLKLLSVLSGAIANVKHTNLVILSVVQALMTIQKQ